MKLLKLFGLILIISCNGQRQNENVDFSDLRDNLPTIITPIVFNSNGDIQQKPFDLPNNQILKDLKDKNYFTVLGKIFESNNFVTIVGYIPDDFGSPILITIDKNGNQLDSFVLYQSVGFDMGYYRSNFVTIYPNKTISLIDSFLTREINEDGSNEIPDSDLLTVTKSEFRLNDNGKIKKFE
ncbi:hypothetical protein [Alkaliflexus imshenetskii]|uniref:hypothetical protein n=1 Tax=Alkaliflexus imshenetskii TaxID=286730 RepID=UPI0012FC91FE|nr:hypothetical protein [Alkaliflexus imshenetskii]